MYSNKLKLLLIVLGMTSNLFSSLEINIVHSYVNNYKKSLRIDEIELTCNNGTIKSWSHPEYHVSIKDKNELIQDGIVIPAGHDANVFTLEFEENIKYKFKNIILSLDRAQDDLNWNRRGNNPRRYYFRGSGRVTLKNGDTKNINFKLRKKNTIIIIHKFEFEEEISDIISEYSICWESGNDGINGKKEIKYKIKNKLKQKTSFIIYAECEGYNADISDGWQEIGQNSTETIKIPEADWYKLKYKFKDGIKESDFNEIIGTKIVIDDKVKVRNFSSNFYYFPNEYMRIGKTCEYVIDGKKVGPLDFSSEVDSINIIGDIKTIRNIFLNGKIITLDYKQKIMVPHEEVNLIVIDMNKTAGNNKKSQLSYEQKIIDLFNEASNSNYLMYKYLNKLPDNKKTFTTYDIDVINIKLEDFEGGKVMEITRNNFDIWEDYYKDSDWNMSDFASHVWTFEPVLSADELNAFKITPNSTERVLNKAYRTAFEETAMQVTFENIIEDLNIGIKEIYYIAYGEGPLDHYVKFYSIARGDNILEIITKK